MNKLLKKLIVFQGIAILLAYMPWKGNTVANASGRFDVVGEKYVFSDSGYDITHTPKRSSIYSRTEFGQFAFLGDVTKSGDSDY